MGLDTASQRGCTARHGGEPSANWLQRRGTRRVLAPASCRAVRLACVRAGTATPTLTPTRSPTLAPTTVVPAVAPSGTSFFEYPSALSTVGCPFYYLECPLYTAIALPLSTLLYPLGTPYLCTLARTCLMLRVALSEPCAPSLLLPLWKSPRAPPASGWTKTCACKWERAKVGMGLSGNGCKWESKARPRR